MMCGSRSALPTPTGNRCEDKGKDEVYKAV